MVKQALKTGVIDAVTAKKYLDEIAFSIRKDDMLMWGAHYFEDKFTLPFCEELHRYLADSSRALFTVTMAPRGHAKTTISCFLRPLYLALNFPSEYRHFLNIQDTATKAIAVNLSIRLELETNEKLRDDYGDQVTKEKWTEKQFVLKNGCIFTAIGSGESVRGINYRNVRPDYVMADDLYNEDCIGSPDQVRKINSWWWSSVYKCVASHKKACFHITGTAISREDILHVLSKNPRWQSKKFQAVNWETGDILWHENPSISLDQMLQDKADMGSMIFEREMQNEIRDDETAIIKMRWIQYVSELPPSKSAALERQRIERLVDTPEHIVEVLMAVDPAEKTKETNDFTGKAVCLLTSHQNFYFVDLRNDRFTMEQNKQDIIDLNKRYAPNVVLFETNKAYGLYKEVQRISGVPLKERIASKDKIERLTGVQGPFENGKVFFYDKISEKVLTEAVDQLTNNTPPHDDIRDAIVEIIEFKRTKRAYRFA